MTAKALTRDPSRNRFFVTRHGCRREEQRFANMLDTGSDKPWHQTGHPVDIIGKEETEVAERFGGPCRGRTYGPLIKSQLLYQLS